LKAKFVFNFARRGDLATGLPRSAFDLYESIETGFRSFQRGVRDIDFAQFVNDLYDRIGTEAAVQAMVLFCHATSQPIEWNSDQVSLMKQLAHALDQGAIIIYVMETDLEGSFRHEDVGYDRVDRQFDKYLNRLDSWRESDAGFIALIRVRHCPFCVPFQKPALFTVVAEDDGESNSHHSVTTVGVPELSNGEGDLGTAVLPQRDEVAHAMRDYLMDMVFQLKKGEFENTDFHFTASGARGSRVEREVMVEKLDFISRYRNAS
jgi:hypothetical protein